VVKDEIIFYESSKKNEFDRLVREFNLSTNDEGEKNSLSITITGNQTVFSRSENPYSTTNLSSKPNQKDYIFLKFNNKFFKKFLSSKEFSFSNELPTTIGE